MLNTHYLFLFYNKQLKMIESLDIPGMVNIAISVSFGSIAATLIVWKLIGYFGRKTIHSILDDEGIKLKTESFIRERVVQPFNSLDNAEIKQLITDTVEKSLEITLRELKKRKE